MVFKRALEIGREIFTLEERTALYHEMADFFEIQAISTSLQHGLLIRTDEVAHLTGVGIQELALIGDNHGNYVQFVRDSNGLYFARIEGGKYYPIDLSFSESMLRQSRHYRKIAESWLRRHWHASVFSFEYRSYLFTRTLCLVSDSLTRQALILDEATKEIRNVSEEFRRIREEMRDMRYDGDESYLLEN